MPGKGKPILGSGLKIPWISVKSKLFLEPGFGLEIRAA